MLPNQYEILSTNFAYSFHTMERNTLISFGYKTWRQIEDREAGRQAGRQTDRLGL
jgi:hypothetical protein